MDEPSTASVEADESEAHTRADESESHTRDDSSHSVSTIGPSVAPVAATQIAGCKIQGDDAPPMSQGSEPEAQNVVENYSQQDIIAASVCSLTQLSIPNLEPAGQAIPPPPHDSVESHNKIDDSQYVPEPAAMHPDQVHVSDEKSTASDFSAQNDTDVDHSQVSGDAMACEVNEVDNELEDSDFDDAAGFEKDSLLKDSSNNPGTISPTADTTLSSTISLASTTIKNDTVVAAAVVVDHRVGTYTEHVIPPAANKASADYKTKAKPAATCTTAEVIQFITSFIETNGPTPLTKVMVALYAKIPAAKDLSHRMGGAKPFVTSLGLELKLPGLILHVPAKETEDDVSLCRRAAILIMSTAKGRSMALAPFTALLYKREPSAREVVKQFRTAQGFVNATPGLRVDDDMFVMLEGEAVVESTHVPATFRKAPTVDVAPPAASMPARPTTSYPAKQMTVSPVAATAPATAEIVNITAEVDRNSHDAKAALATKINVLKTFRVAVDYVRSKGTRSLYEVTSYSHYNFPASKEIIKALGGPAAFIGRIPALVLDGVKQRISISPGQDSSSELASIDVAASEATIYMLAMVGIDPTVFSLLLPTGATARAAEASVPVKQVYAKPAPTKPAAGPTVAATPPAAPAPVPVATLYSAAQLNASTFVPQAGALGAIAIPKHIVAGKLTPSTAPPAQSPVSGGVIETSTTGPCCVSEAIGLPMYQKDHLLNAILQAPTSFPDRSKCSFITELLSYLDGLAQGSKQRGHTSSMVVSITSVNVVYFKLSGCDVTQQDLFHLFGAPMHALDSASLPTILRTACQMVEAQLFGSVHLHAGPHHWSITLVNNRLAAHVIAIPVQWNNDSSDVQFCFTLLGQSELFLGLLRRCMTPAILLCLQNIEQVFLRDCLAPGLRELIRRDNGQFASISEKAVGLHGYQFSTEGTAAVVMGVVVLPQNDGVCLPDPTFMGGVYAFVPLEFYKVPYFVHAPWELDYHGDSVIISDSLYNSSLLKNVSLCLTRLFQQLVEAKFQLQLAPADDPSLPSYLQVDMSTKIRCASISSVLSLIAVSLQCDPVFAKITLPACESFSVLPIAPCFQPNCASGRLHGIIQLPTNLSHSINLVLVKLLHDLGLHILHPLVSVPASIASILGLEKLDCHLLVRAIQVTARDADCSPIMMQFLAWAIEAIFVEQPSMLQALVTVPFVPVQTGGKMAPSSGIALIPPHDSPLSSLPVMHTLFRNCCYSLKGCLAGLELLGIAQPESHDFMEKFLTPAMCNSSTAPAELIALTRIVLRHVVNCDRCRMKSSILFTRPVYVVASHGKSMPAAQVVLGEPYVRPMLDPRKFVPEALLGYFPCVSLSYLGGDISIVDWTFFFRLLGVGLVLPCAQMHRFLSIEELSSIYGKPVTIQQIPAGPYRFNDWSAPLLLDLLGHVSASPSASHRIGLVRALDEYIDTVPLANGFLYATAFCGDREVRLPSAILLSLRTIPWLPSKLGSSAVASELFAPTPQVQIVFGDSVDYLAASIGSELQKELGVRSTSTDDVIYTINRWAHVGRIPSLAQAAIVYASLAQAARSDLTIVPRLASMPWLVVSTPGGGRRLVSTVDCVVRDEDNVTRDTSFHSLTEYQSEGTSGLNIDRMFTDLGVAPAPSAALVLQRIKSLAEKHPLETGGIVLELLLKYSTLCASKASDCILPTSRGWLHADEKPVIPTTSMDIAKFTSVSWVLIGQVAPGKRQQMIAYLKGLGLPEARQEQLCMLAAVAPNQRVAQLAEAAMKGHKLLCRSLEFVVVNRVVVHSNLYAGAEILDRGTRNASCVVCVQPQRSELSEHPRALWAGGDAVVLQLAISQDASPTDIALTAATLVADSETRVVVVAKIVSGLGNMRT